MYLKGGIKMAEEANPREQNPEGTQAAGIPADQAKAPESGAEAADSQKETDKKADEGNGGKVKGEAQTAQFSPVQDSKKTTVQRGLDFILDIPLQVTVELGRTQMLVDELLQLGQGSVVELSKLAGEPMEILVNQKLIARGEVVVVNEKFGVRLTDIISPLERVEQLK
jgi:flagellar motor switch protein FliN/FliY